MEKLLRKDAAVAVGLAVLNGTYGLVLVLRGSRPLAIVLIALSLICLSCAIKSQGSTQFSRLSGPMIFLAAALLVWYGVIYYPQTM